MGSQTECTHFKIEMDVYGDLMRGPIGKNWVIFISIVKESSHSIGMQLVGSYLQAALLKGEGVTFRGRTSTPAVCAAATGRMVLGR